MEYFKCLGLCLETNERFLKFIGLCLAKIDIFKCLGACLATNEMLLNV